MDRRSPPVGYLLGKRDLIILYIKCFYCDRKDYEKVNTTSYCTNKKMLEDFPGTTLNTGLNKNPVSIESFFIIWMIQSRHNYFKIVEGV